MNSRISTAIRYSCFYQSNKTKNLYRPVINGVRNFCSEKSSNPEPKDVKFSTVFMFPYMKYIAPFCSLNKYSYLLSAVTIPAAVSLEYMEYIPEHGAMVFATFSVCNAVFTTMVSGFFKDTIGFIYVSEDLKQIKVGIINFWGKRVDKIIPTDDWVPLSELPGGITSYLYLKPHRYSNSRKMKLFHKMGTIVDPTKAQSTIGIYDY